jgi:hypothetical protein
VADFVAAGGRPRAATRPTQSQSAGVSLLPKAEATYHERHLVVARRWLEEVIRNDLDSARGRAPLALVLARQNDPQGALRGRRVNCLPCTRSGISPSTPINPVNRALDLRGSNPGSQGWFTRQGAHPDWVPPVGSLSLSSSSTQRHGY